MNASKIFALKELLLVLGGFVLGVLVTVGGLRLSIHYFVKKAAELDVSFTPNAEEQSLEAAGSLEKAKDRYERWVALGNAGMWNVDAGALEKAKEYADELVKLANNYKSDWNYGNAVHKGNLIIGRVELKKGNLVAAKQLLLDAGKTPGSPQLNSFGPNMTLAKELLEVGEREVVLEYLELCGKFWKNDFGALKAWRELINAGRVPNFGANLLY